MKYFIIALSLLAFWADTANSFVHWYPPWAGLRSSTDNSEAAQKEIAIKEAVKEILGDKLGNFARSHKIDSENEIVDLQELCTGKREFKGEAEGNKAILDMFAKAYRKKQMIDEGKIRFFKYYGGGVQNNLFPLTLLSRYPKKYYMEPHIQLFDGIPMLACNRYLVPLVVSE